MSPALQSTSLPSGFSAQQALQQKSPTAKLEVPEDYKPSTDDMGRRGRGRARMERLIAVAEKDKERAKSGLAPLQMSAVDRAAEARLVSRADELGIAISPPADVKSLAFNMDRKWRSLDNPDEFLKNYGVLQKRKLEPKVFADERTSGRSRLEVDYISWYQTNRRHWFQTNDRLSDLGTLEKVKIWPNMPDIMTAAPFMRMPPTEHKYTENRENRTLVLMKVLNEKDIARIILGHLAEEGYFGLSNLSQTCHTALNIVGRYVEHWDETPPGDFLGDDVSVDGTHGSPIALVVSPIRKPLSDRCGITYTQHFVTQIRLYRALNNRAATITNLQLHRVQFLNVGAVRCILASLPNLKLLGIYQCQLLHLGNMMQLLKVIQSDPRTNAEDSSFVDLDFFPMFHEGPNSLMRHGSYGAVWNHPDCDMATGIWQLVLYELYPTARKCNIDILKWGCAFRSFMEKLPMTNWANVRIYEAIKSFEYTGKESFNCELDMLTYNQQEGKWQRFIDDVTAALRGDGVEPATIPGTNLHIFLKDYQPERQRKYGWWRDPKQCVLCGLSIPAIFLPFDEGRCWACLAKICLDEDWDHFKTLKQQAASEWFARCRNLEDVTAAGAADVGLQFAKSIDQLRAVEMTHDHGIDKMDWPEHPDMGRLHRRYARVYEPHGPVDRMLNDRQYLPVGRFDSSISHRLVPPCYVSYELNCLMKHWESDRNKESPGESGAVRARLRQQYRQKTEASVKRDASRIIAEQNARDAQEVEQKRQMYRRRLMWPNRQIKCWDELVQDMFFRMVVLKPNGDRLMMPELLTKQKRPHGPIHWTD